jgi:peptide/nickel transport system substrate-binding protein
MHMTLVRTSIAVVLWLAVPGAGNVSASQPSAGSAPLVYGDWNFPTTLNPFQTALSIPSNLDQLIFLPLLAVDAQGRLVPRLLENVPSVANGGIRDGGRTIVLDLRHGVRWSSGALVTNRDVLFGWRLGMDRVNGPFCLGTCDHIASISLQGSDTVVLHLKRPWGPLLRTGLPPVYPHAWPALAGTLHAAALVVGQNLAFNYLDGSYWTDGPYQVTSYQKDDHITFSRMKYFYLGHGPHIGSVIFRSYRNKQSLMAGIASGAVDIGGGYSAGDLKNLESQGLGAELRLRPSTVLDHVEFNVLDKTVSGTPNPVASKRVRQALALVVDRTSMMASALGVPNRATAPFAAFGPLQVPFQLPRSRFQLAAGNWDPLRGRFVSSHAVQLQDARKLLSQAGWPHGFTLDVHRRTGRDDSLRDTELRSLTASWANIGVTVHLVLVPFCYTLACVPDEYLYTGKFEAALLGADVGTDPASIAHYVGSQFVARIKARPEESCMTGPPCNQNFSGIQDPVIDSSLRQGLRTVDETRRTPAYWRLQNRMVKQAYWFPLFFRPTVATAKPGIKGFPGHPDPGSLFWNMNAWSRGTRSE